MSDELSKLDIEYNTYGALERPAMFLGVPLLPAAGVVVFSLLIVLLGMSITQNIAPLLILVPTAVVLLYMKQVSAKDVQALRVIGFEILCFINRKNAKLWNGTHTVFPIRYGRYSNDYKRFIEKYSEPNYQQTTSDFRLYAESLTTHNT